MKKDFWKWHKKKEMINVTESKALFHEREIWWCTLGINIGFEQDGDGKIFTRPVVILSKFNLDSCLIVPLTSSQKNGKYYFPIGYVYDRNATAILSQIRFIDRKRLEVKIGMLDNSIFKSLITEIINMCFNYYP